MLTLLWSVAAFAVGLAAGMVILAFAFTFAARRASKIEETR